MSPARSVSGVSYRFCLVFSHYQAMTFRLISECITYFTILPHNIVVPVDKVMTFPLVDPRGRRGRAPGCPNSFIFMQFSVKNLQNNRLAHALLELVPPQKNPGSATYFRPYHGYLSHLVVLLLQ